MWIHDHDRWSLEVFGMAEFGDKRLTDRLVDYAARQAVLPSGTTHRVCRGNEAAQEGAFRLLHNDRVEPSNIREAGFNKTIERCRDRETIILAEDTTTLTYSSKVAKELGDIGGRSGSKSRGFLVHSALAIDAQGNDILGLIEQDYWKRESKKKRKSSDDKKKSRALPYEKKESYKWQRSSQNFRRRLQKHQEVDIKRFVWVCDRESDIHEYLQYKIENQERFVVRASGNRSIESPHKYLWEHMKEQPIAGSFLVDVAQRGALKGEKSRPARPARQATVEVRCDRVTLTPKDPYHRDRGPLSLNAVFVVEPHPPKDVTPLEWMLLTTEPVGTFEDAKAVVGYYKLRWIIEEFHKAWKTGCRAEARRIQSADPLERLLSVLSFVAVRILQLRSSLFVFSPESCELVLPRPYWRSLWIMQKSGKPLPSQAPSLAWAGESLGRLGGWIKTKRTPLPGWQSLWNGWLLLEPYAQGWIAAQAFDGEEGM